MQQSCRDKKNPSILLVSTCWKGGAGYFVNCLAGAIQEVASETALLAPLSDIPDRESTLTKCRRIISPRGSDGKGWLLYRIIYSIWKSFFSIFQTQTLSKRYDIVFFTMLDWVLIILLRFCLMYVSRRVFIYIIHDPWPHAFSFPQKLQQLEIFLIKLTYLLPSHLVVLTEAAKEDLIKLFQIDGHRISVVPHGAYDPQKFRQMPAKRKFLVFGMLRKNKSIVEVMEAFGLERLSTLGVALTVCGTAHDQDKAYLDLIRKTADRIGNGIELRVGYLEEDALHEEILSSDAIILAYDGFNSQSGAAILAAFMERSIIATEFNGILQLKEYGLNFQKIVTPVTSSTIADAIQAFLQTPIEDWTELNRKSRDSLVTKLAWSEIAEQYRDVASIVVRAKLRQGMQ